MSGNPSRVVGIFPTPVLHVPALLTGAQVEVLRTTLTTEAGQVNEKSSELAHTQIREPTENPLLTSFAELVEPRLVEFGELIFGESLHWSVKEMWLNVLRAGGHQALHSHANSFVSGVVYLTPCAADSSLVFVRGLGQPGFLFKNTHAGSNNGPFNSDKWVMPAVGAGDLVLFPSYMLHEVPVNRGDTRISLAFNAVPQRLDAWGYRIAFSSSPSD